MTWISAEFVLWK